MFLYLYLSKIQFLDNFFDFLDLGEGKAVSSREMIWEFGLKYFYDHPLLGSYYHISKGSGISQLHNTHLDILVSYGLVPALFFIALLYRALERILANSPTKLSNISIFAFFAIIIQGSFEAALVSGGVGLYILSFGFLLIACCSNNSLESSEEST